MSVEKLTKEFGDVLCKPCIVAGHGLKGPTMQGKEYLRYCKCPDTAGHGASGAAHKVEAARARYAGFSEEERQNFRYAK